MNDIDAVKKEKLLECVNYIRNFIEELPSQKSCASCLQWDSENEGCKVSGGQKPPEYIQKNGCPSWVIWDEIPF